MKKEKKMGKEPKFHLYPIIIGDLAVAIQIEKVLPMIPLTLT